MGIPVREFGRAAKGLSGNPLGIIALFITLVYGLAALVTTFSGNLTQQERLPLIWFLASFPILVLGAFVWLVSKHSGKLFAPGDFRDEDNYVDVVTSAASLAAAKHGATAAECDPGVDLERLARIVIRAVGTGTAPAGRILWVDDEPADNIFERHAFTAVGYNFVLAMSTEAALEHLDTMDFVAIISDLRRPGDDRAGLQLLTEVRAKNIETPYFLYTSMNDLSFREQILTAGGQGLTSDPDSLFESVTAHTRNRAGTR
ncbi:response regulator [Nocardia rhizosphaerae]|uniref:Response regulator n=1 Tax=Nocardia rhizosphaerae TaxID=1691571 RepID=A0ABV8LE21_9NOCA